MGRSPRTKEMKLANATVDRAKPVFAVPFLPDNERVAQVWEMRLKGYSHAAIAAELTERFGPDLLPKDYSAKHVYDDCSRALNSVQNEYKESAVEMVGIELGRFDRLLASVWDAAEAGDVRSIEAALAISRERRKLVGLDNPERFQVDYRVQLVGLLQNGTVTPQQIAAEFGEEVLIEVNAKMLEGRE